MIEVIIGINATVGTEYLQFVHDQIIGASLVLSGATYNVTAGTLNVTMAETPVLALARAGALTLGTTLAQSDVSKLDAVGAAMLPATFSHSSASLWNGARAAGTLTATLSCSTASALAGVIYNVTAGTMTVTFGQTSATQRNAVAAASLSATMGETTAAWTARQGALTLPVTMGEQTASQGNVTSSTSFAYHPTMSTASQANTFSATSLGATVSISTLSALAGATYNVGAQLAFTAGITTLQPRLDAVARASFAATMALQDAGLKTVTSSASQAVTMAMTPSSIWNAFSSTSLALGLGFSTLSAIAAATYDKATSLAFTAGLSAPQPRLNAVGNSTLAATLGESSKSQANRIAGATLPIVPGLTALTALPVQAAATLASLFGLSSDGVTNLATVIESLSLDALKAGAQLSARKPGADLSAGRGRTDVEAIKETTDLEAQKGDDSLGGEL